MKKIMSIIISVCLAFTLFGCGDGKNASSATLPDITVSQVETPAPAAAASSKKVSVVKITGVGINVRSKGSLEGEIIGSADKDEYYALKTGNKDKAWIKIDFDGADAYVSAEFAKVESVSEADAKKKLGLETTTDTPSTAPETTPSVPESTAGSTTSSESDTSSGINAADIRGEEDPQSR